MGASTALAASGRITRFSRRLWHDGARYMYGRPEDNRKSGGGYGGALGMYNTNKRQRIYYCLVLESYYPGRTVHRAHVKLGRMAGW